MENPRISVIVPVYNVEKYLPRCIDSILAQTFTDFELLLIDDGSSDNSGKICDKYARKDKRIRVFHKENGGVSSARNIGLDKAKGEWITFVDSDDYVGKNWLTYFYPTDKDKGYLRVQGYEIIQSNQRTCIISSQSIFFCTKSEILKNIIELESSKILLYKTPWNKMYSNSVIKKNNIYFDESVSLGEDYLFTLNYLCHINTLNIIECHEYKYINDNSTLSKKTYPVIIMLKWFYKFKDVCILLAEQSDYYDFYYYELSMQLQSLFRRGFRSGSCLWKDKIQILDLYKMERCSYMDSYFKFPYSLISHVYFLPTNLCALIYTVLFKMFSNVK